MIDSRSLSPHRTGSSAPERPKLTHFAEEGKAGHLVFRVYSSSSACPLVWTGEAETSGFASLNSHLGSLTPSAYAAALTFTSAYRSARSRDPFTGIQSLPPPHASVPRRPTSPSSTLPPRPLPLTPSIPAAPSTPTASGGGGARTHPWPEWTAGPVLRQTIVDHLNKRVRATWDVPWDDQQTGEDGLSPWISASQDAAWAVWEAARRIAYGGEASVHIAVIPTKPHTPRQATRHGVSGEVVLDPHPALVEYKKHGRGTATMGRMTNNEKESVEIALFGASTSREVLFYGRIFAASIVASFEFTANVSLIGGLG